MTRRLLGWIAGFLLFSCTTGQTYGTEPCNNSVTIQGREGRLSAIYASLDSVSRVSVIDGHRDSLMSIGNCGASSESQGLACLADNTLDELAPSGMPNPEMYLDLIRFSNRKSVLNSIITDFEVWERTMFNHGEYALVGNDSIFYALENVNTGKISEPEVKVKLRELGSEMVRTMHSYELNPDDVDPFASYRKTEDELIAGLFEKYAGNATDSVSVTAWREKLVSVTGLEQKRWLEIVENNEADYMLDWMKAIENTEDFDRCCSLAIQGVQHGSLYDPWQLTVLEQLMESGRYSVVLPVVFSTWRCLFQYSYCGMSRDSIIPNYLFEHYRSKVSETMAAHLGRGEYTRNDLLSTISLLMQDPIIRNGSCIMGSDAWLEMWSLLPDFNK